MEVSRAAKGRNPVLPQRTLRGDMMEPQTAESSHKAGASRRAAGSPKLVFSSHLSIAMTSRETSRAGFANHPSESCTSQLWQPALSGKDTSEKRVTYSQGRWKMAPQPNRPERFCFKSARDFPPTNANDQALLCHVMSIFSHAQNHTMKL